MLLCSPATSICTRSRLGARDGTDCSSSPLLAPRSNAGLFRPYRPPHEGQDCRVGQSRRLSFVFQNAVLCRLDKLSAVPAQLLHNSRGRQSFQRLSIRATVILLSPKLARVRAVFSVRIENDDQYFLCCDLAPLGQYLACRTSWFAA